MIKNRTIIALICIILAVVLCFAVAPLVSNLFNGTTSVVTLNSNISAGAVIERSMLGTAQISNADALTAKYVFDPDEIVGKFAKSFLYSGIVTENMFEETITDTNVKLQSLQPGEFAMSVTIPTFAGGLSNKVRSGDIVSIATVEESEIFGEDKAMIMNQLKYVEVIAVTTEEGTDITEETTEQLADTITFKLIDERQVAALLACEESTLHVAFVTRDEKLSKEYIKAQKAYFEELDKKENSENTDNGDNENNVNNENEDESLLDYFTNWGLNGEGENG